MVKIHLISFIATSCFLASCTSGADLNSESNILESNAQLSPVSSDSQAMTAKEQSFEIEEFTVDGEQIGQLSSIEGRLYIQDQCLFLSNTGGQFLLFVPEGTGVVNDGELSLFNQRIDLSKPYRFSGYGQSDTDGPFTFAGQTPEYFSECKPKSIFVAYTLE